MAYSQKLPNSIVKHIVKHHREQTKNFSGFMSVLYGSDLYRNSHTLTILLSGEVISSVYLD